MSRSLSGHDTRVQVVPREHEIEPPGLGRASVGLVLESAASQSGIDRSRC
jgi:hypothetical protein